MCSSCEIKSAETRACEAIPSSTSCKSNIRSDLLDSTFAADPYQAKDLSSSHMASNRSPPALDASLASQPRLCSSVVLCHDINPPPRHYSNFPVWHLLLLSRAKSPVRNWTSNRHPRKPRRPSLRRSPVIPLESVCWEIDSVRACRAVQKESIWEIQHLVHWADTWVSDLLLKSADFTWEIDDILKGGDTFLDRLFLGSLERLLGTYQGSRRCKRKQSAVTLFDEHASTEYVRFSREPRGRISYMWLISYLQ